MQRSAVDSLLRISQAYSAQLCEKQTLELGIAYYSARFAGLAVVNQYREVIAETPSQLRAAEAECHAFFTQRNLYCGRWATAQSRVTDQVAGFLANFGYRPQCEIALSLTQWIPPTAVLDVRILPARAMRSAYRETVAISVLADERDLGALRAEAALERLDSPHLDMFVALHGNQPAGRCGLFQVGDLAEVVELSTLPRLESVDVEHALLTHVLSLAKRLALRNVYARTPAGNADRLAVFERNGFSGDGEITEFVRRPGLPDVPRQ